MSSSVTSSHWLARVRQPGSACHLAVIRMTVAANLFFVISGGHIEFLTTLGATWRPNARTMLPVRLEQLIWDNVGILTTVCLVAAVMMFVGLFTRLATIVATLSFLGLYDLYYRLTYLHNEWPYLWFPLLVLCVARTSDAWSVDALIRRRERAPSQTYRWPVEMIILWVGVTYAAAAYAKLIPLGAGAQWLTGSTVQWLVITRYFDSPAYWILDRPLFDYSMLWPFTILAWLTIIQEGSGLLLLFSRRTYLFCVVCFLSLHAGIHLLTGMPGFFQVAVVSCTSLLPPEWFPDYGQHASSELTDDLNE